MLVEVDTGVMNSAVENIGDLERGGLEVGVVD